MVRLTERRRAVLAEVRRPGKPGGRGLVFGQALGQDTFSFGVGLAGFGIWSVFMSATFFLTGES